MDKYVIGVRHAGGEVTHRAFDDGKPARVLWDMLCAGITDSVETMAVWWCFNGRPCVAIDTRQRTPGKGGEVHAKRV